MSASIRPARVVFALALIGIGVMGLVYGNATEYWAQIPKSLPGRSLVVELCSAIEIAAGLGLLLPPLLRLACRVLLAFLLLWLAVLKLPGLLHHPGVAVFWEQFGETASLTAGAWCIFAAHAGEWERNTFRLAVGENGVRVARGLLAAALAMFGVAHFAYAAFTATLVPPYLGPALGWVYLTGAGYIAGAAGMALGVWPRLSVSLEAAMVWIFTLLVWLPKVVPLPADQDIWGEFVISVAISASVWLVADTYRGTPWMASGKKARAVTLD